jgi:hypothetical protein
MKSSNPKEQLKSQVCGINFEKKDENGSSILGNRPDPKNGLVYVNFCEVY